MACSLYLSAETEKAVTMYHAFFPYIYVNVVNEALNVIIMAMVSIGRQKNINGNSWDK